MSKLIMTNPLEFSRIVDVEQVVKNNKPVSFTANPSECEALKIRLEILDVLSVSVTYQLSESQQPKTFDLKGHLKADVVQSCISTLKPVPEHIDDHFVVILRNEKRPAVDEFDMDAEIDDIDYIEEGQIDLGEIAAQYLVINLDPYPRSKDAPHLKAEAPLKKNPFDVLAQLKDKK
jgi:uncharacterized metal-binding protein YceD (DUF177 family)